MYCKQYIYKAFFKNSVALFGRIKKTLISLSSGPRVELWLWFQVICKLLSTFASTEVRQRSERVKSCLPSELWILNVAIARGQTTSDVSLNKGKNDASLIFPSCLFH